MSSSKKAAAQTAWFIDPVSGSDFNSGSSPANAIKSWGDYADRVGRRGVVSSTVTVLGSLLASDPMLPPFVPNGSLVTLRGTPTAIATATVASVTALDVATQTPWSITVTGLSGEWSNSGPSGSSLVNRRCRVTAGPRAGTVFWVARDLGAQTARISQPTGQSPVDIESRITLQPGDPLVVEALPSVSDLNFGQPVSDNNSPANLSIFDFDLSGVIGCVPQFCNGTFGGVSFNGCYLGGIDGGYQAFGCQFIQFFYTYAGQKTIDASLFLGSVQMFAGASLAVTASISQGGSGWSMSPGALLAAGDLGVFDSSGNGIDCSGDITTVNALWGAGNAGYGLNLHPAKASLAWGIRPAPTPVQPSITGATGDLIIGGDVLAWSAVGAGYTKNGANAYPYV